MKRYMLFSDGVSICWSPVSNSWMVEDQSKDDPLLGLFNTMDKAIAFALALDGGDAAVNWTWEFHPNPYSE